MRYSGPFTPWSCFLAGSAGLGSAHIDSIFRITWKAYFGGSAASWWRNVGLTLSSYDMDDHPLCSRSAPAYSPRGRLLAISELPLPNRPPLADTTTNCPTMLPRLQEVH